MLKREVKISHSRSKSDCQLPKSKLWNNLKSMGIIGSYDINYGPFSANDFNTFFSTHQPTSTVSSPVNLIIGGDFSFHNVSQSDVMEAIAGIGSNSLGLDGIPIKFIN